MSSTLLDLPKLDPPSAAWDAAAPSRKPTKPAENAKPATARIADSAPSRARSFVSGDAVAMGLSLLLPLAATAYYWSYYSISNAARLRHPLNWLLRPSGALGLSLGVIAFSLFIFMWLYPFRKAVKWLAWTGPVGGWMRVHIVAGLALPGLAAVHAGWRFHGMIGMGYISMIVVSLSGIVGRYLYVHIPRKQNGLEMTMEEVAQERRMLSARLSEACGLADGEIERRLALDASPYQGLGPVRTVWRMFRDDITRARMMRELRRDLWKRTRGGTPFDRARSKQAMKLARREVALTQQVRMLGATRRVFRFWHIAHRPFAVTALVALLIHVGVAVFVGGIGR